MSKGQLTLANITSWKQGVFLCFLKGGEFMAINPEVRAAGYAHLGLDVPTNGAGAIVRGLFVVEHPEATGGFKGYEVLPVEVVDLGVHVLATGQVATELTGDETVSVVSYERNPYNNQTILTIENQVGGQRFSRQIQDVDHPLRERIIQGLKPYLKLPRAPFVSEPAVKLGQVAAPTIDSKVRAVLAGVR